ncbi:MAG: hypothetical protein BWY11_02487 [Firmicutes bacterium ADurb.Bin182]|nr:MAG: hypothetical protein BWY11_02487 [Firmicutes bacterium ADurb.Bin182]
MLSVKPMSVYPLPAYPTQDQAANDPELIKTLPLRFSARPAVISALAALISLGLTGCGTGPIPEEPAPKLTENPSASPKQSILQIPVFIHGGGRGSYGCVSVAPPVFLSEEEAAQVIREEAELYGIDFSGNKTLQDISLPVPDLNGFEANQKPLPSVTGDLELDGYDEDSRIGFEFVSVEDVREWSSLGNSEIRSSVEVYDTKTTADALSLSVENTAVFYDPLSADYEEFKPPEFGDMTEEEAASAYEAAVKDYEMRQKEKSLTELRSQVKDFFEWLKGQGII